MIEALRKIKAPVGEIERITVTTHPRWLTVCDIKRPRTGLEVKFSYAHLAAMVAYGVDTSSERAFTDALCKDRKLIDLAGRVTIATDESYNDTTQSVSVRLTSGQSQFARHDLSDRVPMPELEAGLRHKANGLLGKPQAEKLWAGIAKLETLSAGDVAKFLRFPILHSRSMME